MNKGLTKREKVLIIVAAVVALVAVSAYFVILPMVDSYGEKQDQRDELTIEQRQIRIELEGEAAVRESFENAETAVEELRERYPVLMSNEDIGRILTHLCLKHRLAPKTQVMDEEPTAWERDTDAAAPAPPPADAGADAPPASVNEGDADAGTDSAEPKAALYTITATLLLHDEFGTFNDLIKELEEIEYIRVIGFTHKEPEYDGGIMVPRITVSFEITMLGE